MLRARVNFFSVNLIDFTKKRATNSKTKSLREKAYESVNVSSVGPKQSFRVFHSPFGPLLVAQTTVGSNYMHE